MIDLINSAIKDDGNEKFSFYLDGDLSQMSSQRRFLSERGIVIQQNNVYPCLRECDVEKAMRLIWEQRCDGWWHYKPQYLKYGICTEEDFTNRLKRC